MVIHPFTVTGDSASFRRTFTVAESAVFAVCTVDVLEALLEEDALVGVALANSEALSAVLDAHSSGYMVAV